MRGPHNIWRLIRTGATFERTGAMKVALEAMQAPPFVRAGARILGWPFKWLGLKGDTNLPPVTRALTALGPAYIKFGQILSTRPDVVGEELALQLRVLQDKLPPFDTDVAKRMVAEELEAPLEELFTAFSPPVAAASIAQVHRATLRETGQEVAVKVLRPGIERAFRRDIDAFYLIATVIETLSPSSRRLRPHDVIEHFEGVVLRELDLRIESSAAGEFAANTAEDDGFKVPQVNWFLCSRRVMTLDWAEGAPMGDVAASGGYYISMGAERIFAEPGTLTGSIGVVGGKLAVEGLYNKIGITTSVISRGKNSGTFSPMTGFTESEKAAVTKLLHAVYKQFTEKAAEGRKMKYDQLEKLARGRVYTGEMALKIGLVDELGTLEEAIDYARKLGKIPEGEKFEKLILPRPTSPFEQLFGTADTQSRQSSQLSNMLNLLSPELAQQLKKFDLINLLSREKTLTIMPFDLRVN